MSVVSNLIFHNAYHYVTSRFGKRASLTTSNGNTSTLHSGIDYGTSSKKIPQYAIEEGEILAAAKAPEGALYVWVEYPRLGVKFLHYHLDSIKVKKGQKVNANTILGYTGKTGRSTGIHLHLGVKKLSGGDFIDPEKWEKEEYTSPSEKPNKIDTIKEVQNWANTNYKSGLVVDGSYGSKTKKALIKILQTELNQTYKTKLVIDGSFGAKTKGACPDLEKGDKNDVVGVLQALLVCNGYKEAYLDKSYGSATVSAVKSYQKKKGLKVDGIAGRNTFAELCE